MAHPLIEFLSRFISISPELQHALLSSGLSRTFEKGTTLLRQGEPVRYGIFVLSGCVRGYVLKDGEERTLDFFLEQDPIVPLGYGRGEPAQHYLVCVEETTAVVNTPEQEERMLREYPELESICRMLSEILAERLRERLARLQTWNAEERYRYLQANRPDLLQRIPQYQIASYLGVRPESLSRIRRRLSRPAGAR